MFVGVRVSIKKNYLNEREHSFYTVILKMNSYFANMKSQAS